MPESSLRPDEGLDRAIGAFALGANAVNLAVGAGVFALPAAVAGLLGPAAVVAYVLCGLTITCVLLCCAELGSGTTRSGGVIAYTADAFGPLAGFLDGPSTPSDAVRLPMPPLRTF